LTDYAPEFLLGAFAGEANIETFILGSGTVNPGDMVKLSSSAASSASTVVPVANVGDPVIGVVQRVWTAMGTTWVSVVVRGKVKMTAWGSVSIGAKVKAHAQSVFQAWVSGTDAVPAAFGTALQSAACGDTVLVIVDTGAV
jgi:hypothetical protein